MILFHYLIGKVSEFVYNYRNILRFLFSKWSAVTTSDKNKTN
jgi:hypothetical protein